MEGQISCSARWWICGELKTRLKNKWSHLTDKSRIITRKNTCLIFKLGKQIVKRSRGIPGESGAKQEVGYYTEVRAVFDLLRRPRYFL